MPKTQHRDGPEALRAIRLENARDNMHDTIALIRMSGAPRLNLALRRFLKSFDGAIHHARRMENQAKLKCE